ncbi:exodeoxyribonuclease VII small subunit [Jonesia denitrificans]|uniref:Exodeoxyribonuclease 7 small subunit n=1 Tax=Jonesia denitrificans (strain ATCC 14870 / DSM 20603 / BCRC 15368 / CIP 55.134 / JCM 11481 / NBRC 15587 / NCTC 10816 / Prevot 55134) TaxID=471856 RepID=C7R1U0_JONDD|nr:exodeoxyribonuclease VII small subunit [Jonesia denitrificans]ACV08408.1 exodeoxyribonuclease VII, small subunit [Jonesia denitrificans DSM 20603]ASE07943.1 exodeoxyribonuclease VII small subunit [Jonesia denitrificans]QXB42551.1 exodeoxyribonuclease VII small subunit [Jonesia denitrificans]SQH20387.1 exodeoxyribonuclease VII small subunit [Jonesia denitrificans]
MSDNTHADIESMPYEEARDELIGIVQRLETGNETLENSLALWERGELLAQRCQQWLDGARTRLEKVRAHTEQLNNDEE